MKIGLNLLPFVPGVGGAWNYVENLIGALARHDRDNEYICFVTSASAPLVPPQANFTRCAIRLRAQSRPLRIAFENSILPLLPAYRALDCLHQFFGTVPVFGRKPTVITVFDVMVFARPADFPSVKRAYLRMVRRRAARTASVLAPMSRSTANALHEWLAVPEERMTVIPAMSRPQLARRDPRGVADFRRKYDLPHEFWLCVAGPYPHKNLDRLIQAAALGPWGSDRWTIVIRGEPLDQLVEQVEASGLRGRVRFLPWLTDDEMGLLYSAASALVFPSLYEGGGIPVLEAMACGCPVVASNIPTTREFAGPAALTFDPESVTDIARAMAECEGSPTLRADLAARGTTQVAQFHSGLISAACHTAYRRAIANGT